MLFSWYPPYVIYNFDILHPSNEHLDIRYIANMQLAFVESVADMQLAVRDCINMQDKFAKSQF